MDGEVDDREKSSGKAIGKVVELPDVPEAPLLHVAIEYRERLDTRLAEEMLLDVARKQESPRCSVLVDFPLDRLPEPDPTDPEARWACGA